MNLLVVRGVDDKLQTHIVKRLREFHATLERHATSRSSVRCDRGLGAFRGGDVKARVHRIAEELNVASLIDVERLERDDGQRILHLAAAYRIASVKAQPVGSIVEHAQVAATDDVNVVRLVGVKCTEHVRSFVDADGEVHVESVDGRTLHGGLPGSAEVDKRDKSFEAVVRRERRVAQDVRDVR